MAGAFRIRDFFRPRENILREAGIKSGDHVLDYGCGPGGYVASASRMAGKAGKVYALDIHRLAIEMVKDIASKKQLNNVETICSDCKTGLKDNSVDVVLLYDTFHALKDPNRVLKELHRVLKSSGIMSFSDHHMREKNIVLEVTDSGLFGMLNKGEKTYSFIKEK
jgi:ubiquinone/menaquinone biosynthesis C-methylase UbiE